MKNIENGHCHHTLVCALSCVLLMAVAAGISEHIDSLVKNSNNIYFYLFSILNYKLTEQNKQEG